MAVSFRAGRGCVRFCERYAPSANTVIRSRPARGPLRRAKCPDRAFPAKRSELNDVREDVQPTLPSRRVGQLLEAGPSLLTVTEPHAFIADPGLREN